MHILFITYDYPSLARPFYGAFVRNLIRAIALTGAKCTVINPVSYFHRKYGKLDPVSSWDSYVPGNPIEIKKPRYLSLSSRNLIFFNTELISHYYFDKAVFRTLNVIKTVPDVLYGHFIYPSGVVAANLGFKKNITSIVAVGEDDEEDFIGKDRLFRKRWDIRHVQGVIAVSSLNKKRCIEELNIPENKILLSPNGVDFNLFYPRDRLKMRLKYNLPLEKTIIAFTGHFTNRKGPTRLLQAIKGLDNIGVVLIGSGSLALENKYILFKGVLEHETVPEMLSAADMFVLPTLSEGSCNAILEAMSCGLPVISSSGEFNDGILNNKVAIRVNPLDIIEIRNAIDLLLNDVQLRNTMSIASLNHVKQFNIHSRARKIIEWIRDIQNGQSFNKS
jgi:teichuronic acid biosynthesis glycosyltransferase TuaC